MEDVGGGDDKEELEPVGEVDGDSEPQREAEGEDVSEVDDEGEREDVGEGEGDVRESGRSWVRVRVMA